MLCRAIWQRHAHWITLAPVLASVNITILDSARTAHAKTCRDQKLYGIEDLQIFGQVAMVKGVQVGC